MLLESATVPDEKALAPFVLNGISKLAIEAVDSLQVYGRQAGEKYASWSRVYTLGTAKPITADRLTTNTQDTTNVQLKDKESSLEDAAEDSLNAVATHLNHVIADEKVTVKVIL